MKARFSPRLVIAALTLSLGLAAGGSALARGKDAGPEQGKPGHHLVMHERAMNRLHDELKLDEKQDTLWKVAEKYSSDHRATMRERFQKERAEIKGMLDQPGADLRAVAKRMDDLKAESAKERDGVRDRWLTVYDSLNAEQKEKARVFFKTGFERMEHRGDHRGPQGKDRPARNQPQRGVPSPAPQG